jgi:hypothetical protein
MTTDNFTICPICRQEVAIIKDPHSVFIPEAYSLHEHMTLHTQRDIIKEFVAYFLSWRPYIDKK